MKIMLNSLPKSGTNYISKVLLSSGFKYADRSIAASTVTGRYEFLKKTLRSSFGPVIDVGLQCEAQVSKSWLSSATKISDYQFATGHAKYTHELKKILDENSLKVIMVHRSPQAVLHSWIMYQDTVKLGRNHISNLLRGMNYEQRFYVLLNGVTYKNRKYQNFKKLHDEAIKWLSLPDVVSFEFIGNRVKDKKTAIRDIKSLFEDLNLDVSDRRLQLIYEDSFARSETFRSGNDTEWKEFWNKNMIKEFQKWFEVE